MVTLIGRGSKLSLRGRNRPWQSRSIKRCIEIISYRMIIPMFYCNNVKPFRKEKPGGKPSGGIRVWRFCHAPNRVLQVFIRSSPIIKACACWSRAAFKAALSLSVKSLSRFSGGLRLCSFAKSVGGLVRFRSFTACFARNNRSLAEISACFASIRFCSALNSSQSSSVHEITSLPGLRLNFFSKSVRCLPFGLVMASSGLKVGIRSFVGVGRSGPWRLSYRP
jgi:hypothetical protein